MHVAMMEKFMRIQWLWKCWEFIIIRSYLKRPELQKYRKHSHKWKKYVKNFRQVVLHHLQPPIKMHGHWIIYLAVCREPQLEIMSHGLQIWMQEKEVSGMIILHLNLSLWIWWKKIPVEIIWMQIPHQALMHLHQVKLLWLWPENFLFWMHKVLIRIYRLVCLEYHLQKMRKMQNLM